jgi:CO/xanthine dehydrogenase FAD-binding subunit
MGDEPNVAARLDPEWLQYERMQGELDAAMVFAAAAQHQYQLGKAEIAATCLSDAMDVYEKVRSALAAADLSGSQLQDLGGKLIRLKNLLDSVRPPRRNEAA